MDGKPRVVRASTPRIELSNFPKCEHQFEFPVSVTVKGTTLTVNSMPGERRACAACLQAYLEEYSATCFVCKKPILPYMQIAEKEPNKEFAHAGCAPAGCMTGYWGEGKPVDLEFSFSS